jgi:hypothetical protein
MKINENMTVLYGLTENNDALEKGGKKALLGEIRHWKNKEGGTDAWVKHKEGWVQLESKTLLNVNEEKTRAEDHHLDFANEKLKISKMEFLERAKNSLKEQKIP